MAMAIATLYSDSNLRVHLLSFWILDFRLWQRSVEASGSLNERKAA